MSDHAAAHDAMAADDASAEHGHAGHAEGDFAHPFPVWGLIAVFLALVFLTFVTVAQAHFNLGGWDVLLSLFIATIKASLVVLFFMHLAADKPFNAIVFVSSLLFVALFLVGTLTDSQLYRTTLEPQTGSPTDVVE